MYCQPTVSAPTRRHGKERLNRATGTDDLATVGKETQQYPSVAFNMPISSQAEGLHTRLSTEGSGSK